MKAKHYYEIHVTIDPVEDREKAQSIASKYKFKLAKLLMDKGIPSQLDTFMTGHAKDLQDGINRTIDLVKDLQLLGYNIRRYKIEDTIMDSRINDELKLNVSKDKEPIKLEEVE